MKAIKQRVHGLTQQTVAPFVGVLALAHGIWDVQPTSSGVWVELGHEELEDGTARATHCRQWDGEVVSEGSEDLPVHGHKEVVAPGVGVGSSPGAVSLERDAE